MSTYQITINLVVEVEADSEGDACYEAKHSIDYGYGEVVEEDILEVALLELRCCECSDSLDPDKYNDHDGVVCQKCEEELSEEENEMEDQ
jgi:hypothetical protein